ncbi:MAG TPA: glutathione S-transferase [Geminicoccaceae bacterium]
MRIWGRVSSINVQKVMWTVGELGLEHERIDAGGSFGRLDTPEFGTLNPNRKVPVLEDGEVVLWESNAIVRYLAARHATGSLWPEDPARRALSDRWMDWKTATLIPDMTVVFWGLIRTPEAERDTAAIEAAAARMVPNWRILDAHLDGRPYVLEDALTIGDIAVGAAVHRYLNLPLARPALPAVEAYYERLKERPAYRDHVMLPVT